MIRIGFLGFFKGCIGFNVGLNVSNGVMGHIVLLFYGRYSAIVVLPGSNQLVVLFLGVRDYEN